MNVEDIFLDYVADYLNDSELCKYKVDHSFRVRDIAIEIGKSLNLSSKDLALLNICGILHDIGRFEQYRRYKTFVDSDCVSHCNIGYDVLSDGIIFDKLRLDSVEREIVLCAVLNHGALKVDDSVVGKKKKFVDIIMDADKLDILNNAVLENISLNIGDDAISDAIYKNIFDHEIVNLNKKVSRADRICIWFGFVFGLHFLYSFEHLNNHNIIPRLSEIYRNKTCNTECKSQILKIEDEINNYIKSKINEGEIVC